LRTRQRLEGAPKLPIAGVRVRSASHCPAGKHIRSTGSHEENRTKLLVMLAAASHRQPFASTNSVGTADAIRQAPETTTFEIPLVLRILVTSRATRVPSECATNNTSEGKSPGPSSLARKSANSAAAVFVSLTAAMYPATPQRS